MHEATSFLREKGGELIDRFVKSGEESPTKEFQGAYLTLMYLIEAKKQKKVSITSEGIKLKGERHLGFLITGLINNMEYHRKEGNLKDEINSYAERYGGNSLLRETLDKYCRGMFE